MEAGGYGRVVQNNLRQPMLVVLDIDETLIHSKLELVGMPGEYLAEHDPRQEEQREGCDPDAQNFDFEFTVPVQSQMGTGELRVKVHKRPGLDRFLEEASSFCQLAVFTAGTEDYANALLDKLDPCGRMGLRLYRDSCSLVDGMFLKDLNKVVVEHGDRDLSRVVLVDNSPVSLLINPENSILLRSFYTDPDDRVLSNLLVLLRRLHHAGDVRPALEREFGLRRTLENSGYDLDEIARRHLAIEGGWAHGGGRSLRRNRD